MKRVNCLYRVSTKGQVDKDDIPMQRQVCKEFIEKQEGWVLTNEYYEKGISGFKVSATNRDAIQDLKQAAERKEFDVLLVFMFDRLGRIANETPFIVEWFVHQGIEVWSTQEGQQRFENEADYLINYVRFWQAGGESKKTSTRVKTRMRQLTEQGTYTGGVTPYGYKLVKSGRLNKKNKELMDISINDEEAAIVRIIFHKTVYEGYGSFMMAEFLNSKGLKTHNGSKFQCNTINRILKNRMYCGYFLFGETESPFIERLRIIDENLFFKAQYILSQRAQKEKEKQHIARTTKGKTLLSGNIYCGHCGQRLIATSFTERYITKDGKEHASRRQRYVCTGSAMKRCKCDGATGYVSSRIDEKVSDIVKKYLLKITETPKDQAIETRYKKNMEGAKAQLKKLMNDYEKNAKKLYDLSNEIAKTIAGESHFTAELLVRAIENAQQEQKGIELKIAAIQKTIDNQNETIKNLDNYYSDFRNWAEVFESGSQETKKMIICQLIKEIRVFKNYRLEITLNMNYEQFLNAA